MKKNILILGTFVLIASSCGRVSQRQSANAVSESSNTLTLELNQDCEDNFLLPLASEIDSLVMVLIAEAIHTPVGSSLVLKTFEEKWVKESFFYNGERSDSEKWLLNLGFNFSQQYSFYENNAIMIDREYFCSLFNITSSLRVHNMPLNEQFRAIAIRVAEYQNFILYSFLTEQIELECIYCEHKELVRIQSLVSIANNRVIDNLIAAYTFSDGFVATSQFFFYDDKRIHIKQFKEDEIEGWFIDYRKLYITPQGGFIRYAKENRKEVCL